MEQLYERRCLGAFPLRMGHKFLSGYFRSVVGPVCHLVDGNIAQQQKDAQKVAVCIITLTEHKQPPGTH